MKISLLYEMIAHHYINQKKVTRVRDMSGGKGLLILATGESAGQYWNKFEKENTLKDYDVLVMNRTIYKLKEEIFKLKPKYFAACDSIYWGNYEGKAVGKEVALETYHRTKEVLEAVDWECFLITTIHEKFDFNNDKVHIIRINAAPYDKSTEAAFFLYKYNFCNPVLYNIAQVAIYFGVTFGYKEIGLVGVDFDFFRNLYCDELCRIEVRAKHQYENKTIDCLFDRGQYGHINNSVLAKYLFEIADTVSKFGKLGIYAERQKCKIINYSVRSMLDCYEKKEWGS